MRRTALLVSTVVAGLVAALIGSAPAASASEKYPVPYNFLPYAVAGGAQADPPGANDWSCKPTRKHSRPVVLVHGTFGNKSTNWQTYAPLLHNKGYCVFALTYGVDRTGVPGSEKFGGMTRMQDSAKELKRFVAKVRKATGARKVDLVGHSQGTLMPTWWLKYLGGAPYVKRYVSLAPLWHGTQVAEPSAIAAPVFGADDESTPVCVACGQFRSGSPFMKKIRAGGGPGNASRRGGVAAGTGLAEVTATGMRSELGRIAHGLVLVNEPDARRHDLTHARHRRARSVVRPRARPTAERAGLQQSRPDPRRCR